MAAQDGLTFEGTFNNVTTGLYKDNTTNDISEADLRLLPTSIRESFLNRIDNLSLISSSTAGATITLDFDSSTLAYERKFVGSASFATPKTIALGNNTNAVHFTFLFTITDVAATLTFPAGFKSFDSRFASLVFTSLETGTFKATADFDGTSWFIDFSPIPYV